jgi:hypothetical protein
LERERLRTLTKYRSEFVRLGDWIREVRPGELPPPGSPWPEAYIVQAGEMEFVGASPVGRDYYRYRRGAIFRCQEYSYEFQYSKR